MTTDGRDWTDKDSIAVDAASVPNAVLQRLIAEVKRDQDHGRINAYNRMHNRHNRSR